MCHQRNLPIALSSLDHKLMKTYLSAVKCDHSSKNGVCELDLNFCVKKTLLVNIIYIQRVP